MMRRFAYRKCIEGEMVTLAELVTAVGATANKAATALGQTTLTDVTADSNSVVAGGLFAAIPGTNVHGARFARQAFERGAIAVITDAEGRGLIDREDLPILEVERLVARLGEIAGLLHGNPAAHLRSFGVTGTNGKTTTTYMLEDILSKAGRVPALIGGVELKIAGASSPTDITTPLPVDLQRMLATHLEAGGTDFVMEVTSHAMLQYRTDPIRFAVAGFTHLSQDHLDYHPTIEHYFEAKSSLFTAERCEQAVISVDDVWGERLFALAQTRLDHVYALALERPLPSNVRGWWVEKGSSAGQFVLHGTDGRDATFTCGLPGDYNIANAALAITMALAGGVPLEAVPRTIAPTVPGRMEIVSESSPRVIVDFAHNADALAKAISALRPTTEGRLIALTGTAGDRDATKRFAMGEATAKHADVVVITDDDPHTEDPARIRAALIEGTVGHDAEVIEIGDRTEAIRAAVMLAADEDTVIIAGRGHWTVQFVGEGLVELDDREAAREALVLRAERSE
jgi:UDP-N-acetylmuramoyl-L-alanyl-D-glutamate--2,6-diaminopimelate ligase